jgi:hypothetical protein
MPARVLSTQKSIYPLAYDKNGKSNIVGWRKHITAELVITLDPVEYAMLDIHRVISNANMKELKSRKTRLTRKQWIKADRIAYTILIAATLLAIAFFKN